MSRRSRHLVLHGLQESAGTGGSANAAGEVDLGSGRHTHILEDSSSTVDSPAVLRQALSAALCLAGLREPELCGLLDDMVPDISELLPQHHLPQCMCTVLQYQCRAQTCSFHNWRSTCCDFVGSERV